MTAGEWALWVLAIAATPIGVVAAWVLVEAVREARGKRTWGGP